MTIVQNNDNRLRYHLIDVIRGVCVLGMIAYHTLFDAVTFFNVTVPSQLAFLVDIIRDFGAACFICISGICFNFGRKPLKRGLIIFTAGIIVSLVTAVFSPNIFVLFGILTFMGTAPLISLPLKRLMDKLPALPMAVLMLFMFLLTFNLRNACLGIYSLVVCYLPECLYRNYFTAFLGFPFIGFSSLDYYPLFPWLFMYYFGFFVWKVLCKHQGFIKILSFRIAFFEKIGKWSLYIYMAHQPIILGILMLISYLISII